MSAAPLIISLTAIPSRFDKLGPTLESLLTQTARVEEIRLNIPHRYRRFPEYEGMPPDVPKGVRIVRPEEDLGPATKVLFATRDLRGTDTRVLFCDDDRFYPPNWAAQHLQCHADHPEAAVCCLGFGVEDYGFSPGRRPGPLATVRTKRSDWNYRRKRLIQKLKAPRRQSIAEKPPRRLFKKSGYTDIFCGVGGVVVRPHWFSDDAYDIPSVLWTVDDVWLSGHLTASGRSVWVNSEMFFPRPTEAELTDALMRSTIEGHGRREANSTAIRYMRDTYGIWGGLQSSDEAHSTA